MVMNKKKIFFVVNLFLLLNSSFSQIKYWVKLSDKNGSPYSISNPSAFLSNASIQRRITYNIPIHFTDLPVTPSYITQINAVSGATVVYASKWLNGLVVSVTNTMVLNTINSFSFVLNSSLVNRFKLDIPKITEPIVNEDKENLRTNLTSTFNYGGSYWQTKQLNLDCIHNQGFRGQGITIAVLDAGFLNANANPVFDSLFNRGGVLGTRDFVSGGTNVYDDDAHGTMVLSCMAAIKPNVIMGSAPRANYWLLRTEDANTEKLVEEYNWIRGAEFADSVGVDILSTSLGYTTFDNPAQNHTFSTLNGKTAPMSIAANLAARKGLLVLNSAGNGGGSSWSKISIPADADSICTVGAIDSLNNVTSFSSLGPTADNRIKPDLLARGGNAWVSLGTSGSCFQANGTSFSCPILAGAMACFWQAHPTFTSYKVLDTLKKTASNFSAPNNSKGWGIPNMCAIPTSISEKSLIDKINVYPNPFNTKLKITKVDAELKMFKFQIINVLGEVIKVNFSFIENNIIEFDFSDVSSGIYFFQLDTEFGIVTKKIIKQ